ncbi:uncharacterized protein METZ01_LOCUS418108, partial [marine metagenome]
PEEEGEDDILMDLDEINLKKILSKLKIPSSIIKHPAKLTAFLQQNPVILTQVFKLLGEDVNVDKDGFRTYSDPEDSDIDEPYKRETPTNENVTLPIKVGDTLLMGRFKNKRVKIKTITTNEKGDLLINGRTALKFRMPDGGKVLLPKPPEISANPFDENTMLEFLTTINMGKLINEITATSNAGDADEFGAAGQQMVDSGPNMFFDGMAGYTGRNKKSAEDLGWEVVNYILDVDVKKVPPFDKELNNDRPAVSYMPAGIGTGITPNNPENLTG